MHSLSRFSLLARLGLAALLLALPARAFLELEWLGTYVTGVFDEAAQEIAGYDPGTQRLFITNANSNTIDIVGLDALGAADGGPYLVSTIELGEGSINSVAVFGSVVAAAIAADPKTDPGRVAFFDVDGNLVNELTVGVLPDMLTFSPDGSLVITANEGEPNEEVTLNPEGSVSIIDFGAPATLELAAALSADAVTTATFNAFDDMKAALAYRGVRFIYEGASVSENLEPEYVAVSPDGALAFVTLQENNAVAVVDLEAKEIVAVQALGWKDHINFLRGLDEYEIDLSDEILGTDGDGNEILLGGLSGLAFVGYNEAMTQAHFVAIPDRGPNGPSQPNPNGEGNVRTFPTPDYQPRIVPITLDLAEGIATADLDAQIFLTYEVQDGIFPLTGLPNAPTADEVPVDLNGQPLGYDPLGADLEGIAVAEDGTYWMVDEYRPAIYHFDATGKMVDRFVPAGIAEAEGMEPGTFGTESLPAHYNQRRANRGFEAVVYEDGLVYAFMQSPMDNPDNRGRRGEVMRVLVIDAVGGETTDKGAPVAEYLHFLQGTPGVDKIGDATRTGRNGVFLAIERDSSTGFSSHKHIVQLDFTVATNILGTPAAMATGEEALELKSVDEIKGMGIRGAFKYRLDNLSILGYRAGDKPEGLAMPLYGPLANQWVVVNDNDFGMADAAFPFDGTALLHPDPVGTILGVTRSFLDYAFDASNRDDAINLQNWPTLGMYQPDAIAAFEDRGDLFLITANEGDAADWDGFSEETRVEDLTLDPWFFAAWGDDLQDEARLGRLRTTEVTGDLDGDGDFDRVFSYGARSITVWDLFGNVVFDTGAQFEALTAGFLPEYFNSNNDDQDSFDSRSDDKGPEPEGITVAEVYGFPYAFVGLERMGGVLIYDLFDPLNIVPLVYYNNRDFTVADAESIDAGDLGPEGLLVIAAADSPTGTPLLVVTNEVSGTTAILEILERDHPDLDGFEPYISLTARGITDGAIVSSWFGYFDATLFPFIVHETHGNLAVALVEGGGYWLYDLSLGWIYTDGETHPYFWRHDTQSWLYYDVPSADPRVFYDFGVGAWVFVD